MWMILGTLLLRYVMIKVDKITLGVIQAGLQQVCDEMDLSFSRSAFSPVISEANDRSNGIYSAIVNAGENNKYHEIIYGLKSGDRKSYNFTVSKKQTIKGKVLNLDGQPQYGVVVQALGLNKKGIEDTRHMFTVHTSENGEFEFSNLPLSLKYLLRIHGEQDFVYYKSGDDKKKIFNLINSKEMQEEINFKIPRIKTPGTYPFFFDQGFLKNLKGLIQVSKSKNRCLFHTTAAWTGPHSGINDTIFAFFSKALSELAMRNLFRISQTF